MKRAGFTLIEVSIVIAIMVVIMVAVWSALSQLGRSEQATDREATRALLQSRLAEVLQRDLRSAKDARPGGEGEYLIERWMPAANDRLEIKLVTWKKVDAFKISRTVEGEPPQEWNFRGLLNQEGPGVRFRIDGLGDEVFRDL